MAHLEQQDFFAKLLQRVPEAFTEVTVLEVGSLDINGSVRHFFDSTEYVGVDVAPGPCVEVVGKGEELEYPDNSFDVTISVECFEHNPEWAATFANMWRMSKTFIIMTCASTGRPEHGTTNSRPEDSPYTLEWDYYRNLTEVDFTEAFDLDVMFSEYFFEYNPKSCDLYFFGVKRHA
jgi:SAM-dependent methyltransferase